MEFGRKILHSDMNCFYASVEMMLDPSLRGRAVAVCGSTEDRHGIVLAKSEKAKRAGVRTGMVNHEARAVCPELIMVEPHYEQYLKYSHLAREIYYDYTDLVEPFGMDECWLDVTDSVNLFGGAEDIAKEINSRIKSELGITVSVGVSFNKIFAKLGSDMKKPDAVTVITPENFRQKVWPLPAGDLLYAGRATVRRLTELGIYTIGDLANTEIRVLKSVFGVNGLKLYRYANGTDCSRVAHKDFVSPVKSIGHGITCNADLENDDEVRRVILSLSQDIGHKLRVHSLKAEGVQVSVRSRDLIIRQFQTRLPLATMLPADIALNAYKLFLMRYNWYIPVRSITVRAINLVPAREEVQLDLFNDYARLDRLEKMQLAVEDIRRRFGKGAINPCSLYSELKIADKGASEIIMPGMMFG